jgi:hypothetical protein
MQRGLRRKILAAAVLAAALSAALGGCGSAIVDHLPGDMGLPAGAPARPATPYEYPAVHDMPPPRATESLTEAEQVKLEKDLQESRDRQQATEAAAAAQDARDAQQDSGKTPAPPAKNKAAAVKKKKPGAVNPGPSASSETSGAKTSGAKTNP